MANVSFCGLKPLLFRRRPCGFEAKKGRTKHKKSLSKCLKEESTREPLECSSFVGGEQLMLMMHIQKKILAFRDIVDLAPCNTSSLRKMVIKTLEDMRRIYPGIIPKDEVSEIKGKSMDKVLAYFCRALKSLGESWMTNNDGMNKFNYEFPSCKDRHNVTEQGETVLAALDFLIMLASDEKFDTMEEDEQKKEYMSPGSSFSGNYIIGSSGSFSDSNLSCSTSPVTPKSVLLPDFMKHSASRAVGGDSPKHPSTSPLLWSLRVQAVGKLNPIDVKRLPFCMSPPSVETHSDKIDEQTSEDMEMDEKSSDISEEDTSGDLVFHFDTTHELDDTTRKIDHKPTNTHSLPQQPQSRKSLSSPSSPPAPPSPSPSTPLSSAHTHSSLQILQVRKSLFSPSPPPPSSSLPPLPPPPPPPPSLPRYSGSSAAVVAPPPPAPLKDILDSAATAPPPPPPPPVPLKTGSVLAPPPTAPCGNGAGPPPPPPPGVGKSTSLRPKATKLKRSTQIGALYRKLKGKVEGPSLHSKSAGGGIKTGIGGGGSTGGKQGMADALAEMTRRSSYFQQIEEDVQKYTEQITQLGPSIANFKNKDMAELVKFHRDVESVLENLTDETQVLSRFEGFPTKKLEAIRMATALFKKLNSILIELENWKVVPPVGQLLDRVERYFNKIKTEIDALERTKDEESQKFKSHNVEFDFHIIVKIKEAMVDVSSNCMELALKERHEMAAILRDSNSAKTGLSKMLWRAFQFAFRVYTFAGGLDDRADRLTRELAAEIESDPPMQ